MERLYRTLDQAEESALILSSVHGLLKEKKEDDLARLVRVAWCKSLDIAEETGEFLGLEAAG